MSASAAVDAPSSAAGRAFGEFCAFSCVVRDLSDRGANLDIPSQIGIPHEFMLSIPTAELHRPCRTVWRSDKRIGIALTSGETAGA
ncbi:MULTISPECIES: PilZ domain-containing protein [unclassified Bradyrhizobium]